METKFKHTSWPQWLLDKYRSRVVENYRRQKTEALPYDENAGIPCGT